MTNASERGAAAVLVRPAVPADAEAAVSVMRRSIAELCGRDHGNDPVVLAAWLANKTPDVFRRWLATGSTVVVATSTGGAILGVGGCNRVGEITLNYVNPDCRFAGVSSALLADLEARLRKEGLAECRLVSTETAHRFYLGRGFVDDGKPVPSFGAPAQPMRKPLPA
jgi:GNAT superfamily N-acetyltransferase